MSPVQPSSLILVSDANGFIAVWIVKFLLERGFKVRGTVRNSSKGDYMRDLFKDYSDKFEYFVVRDITTDGAFDEAVKGADGVVHAASPVTFTVDDPQELIKPALEGLNAEKIGFDSVTVLPPFVFGRSCKKWVSSPEQLNLSVKVIHDFVTNASTYPESVKAEDLTKYFANSVDVRDVARAVSEVLVSGNTGGERFIIAERPICLQDVLDALNTASPPLLKLPFGHPGAGKSIVHPAVYDGSKITRVLGFEYTPFEDTMRDMVRSIQERGW